MNENRILKVRIDELSSKIVSMERKLDESTASIENLSHDVNMKKEELDEAAKKYQRAEKIAAHLEKQFRVCSLSLLFEWFTDVVM